MSSLVRPRLVRTQRSGPALRRRPCVARGFSLLEVVVALSILSLSLIVLLQAQGQALGSAAQARDLSMATLLARGKMIDLEQRLFKEGFVLNEQEEEGDFRDQGFEHMRWRTKVSPVQLDLTALTDLCDSLGKKAAAKKPKGKGDMDQAVTDCASTMSTLGGMLQSFTQEIGDSMRAAELVVSWPEGRYQRDLRLHALLTKDDYSTQQQGDLQRQLDQSGLNKPTQGQPGLPTGMVP